MSGWAKPGVKCVVVDNAPIPNTRVAGSLPGKGCIVEIKAVIPSRTRRALFNVVINGHPNIQPTLGGEIGWRVDRFRPLITKTQKQDVALFRHILDGLPVGEPV